MLKLYILLASLITFPLAKYNIVIKMIKLDYFPEHIYKQKSKIKIYTLL